MATIALAWPLGASADYGYSKFGMSPDEVVAASNGTAKRIAARTGSEVFNLSMLVEGTVRTGETIRFYFSKTDERLMLVKIIPRPESCDGLDTGFSKTWGAPIVAEHEQLSPDYRTDLTRWRVSGDLVTLARFQLTGQPDSCHLLFQPPGTKI